MLGDQLEDVHAPSSTRINGVTVAVVVDNLDAEGQGRVQLSFPWMPDVLPGARTSEPVAGNGAGIWALPQIGDEVLVAFANGENSTHPYVLGGLWSMGLPRPPAPLPTDSQTKRVIKTPTGHAITLDDVPPAITIEHVAGHKIELTATGIKISTTGGAASIELTTAGAIKIKGTATVDCRRTGGDDRRGRLGQDDRRSVGRGLGQRPVQDRRRAGGDQLMPPAARILDLTGHPGTVVGPGVASVLLGGLPAAVVGDMHACTFPPPAGPHPPTPFPVGSSSVLIGGRPALRMGDMAGCGAPIVLGAPTVLIGG